MCVCVSYAASVRSLPTFFSLLSSIITEISQILRRTRKEEEESVIVDDVHKKNISIFKQALHESPNLHSRCSSLVSSSKKISMGVQLFKSPSPLI